MSTSHKPIPKVPTASAILFLTAAVCAILIAVNLLTYALEVSALAVSVEPNQNPDSPTPRPQDPAPPSESKKLADALKQKNIFQPPPPKPQPPAEARGILGNQALIAGKWYKVGDTVPPGAKVMKIEASGVRLEWEGKEIVLLPIKASAPPAPPPAAKPKDNRQEEPKNQPNAAGPEQGAEPARPAEGDNLAWLNIPDRMRERFREAWNQMSPEQQQQLKDRWNNMSEEERRQMMMSFRPRGDRRPNRN